MMLQFTSRLQHNKRRHEMTSSEYNALCEMGDDDTEPL